MNKTFHRYVHLLTGAIVVILFSISLWQLATVSWIQGKALIAQQLLNHSWQNTMNDAHSSADTTSSVKIKPWPWADTWPVAKLFAPQHAIEQIVLAGDSGNSLAFAPGYSLASALPNTQGTTIISAHRDTHFSFLKDIELNDILYLQTVDKTIHYQVYDVQIVDSKTYTVRADSEEQALLLVTCYPFDALANSGSLRYLVFARKAPPKNNNT